MQDVTSRTTAVAVALPGTAGDRFNAALALSGAIVVGANLAGAGVIVLIIAEPDLQE